MVIQATGTARDPFLNYPTSFNPGDGTRPRYNTVGTRQSVFPRPLSSERTLGIICTGQSTIANWGGGTFYTASSPRSHQGNIYDGQVYLMEDSNFGADGVFSSPASAIGDFLISQGKYDRVTVVNVSFGSTSSAQWADANGYLFKGYKCAYQFLVNNGYTNIVHLHQQGERDAQTSVSQATMLTNLIAFDANKTAAGMMCPMYISQTTYLYDWNISDPSPANWTPGPFATGIRNAQAASWNGTSRRQGPDTDTLRGSPYRTGDPHWSSQTGIIACANLWANVL